MTTHIKDQFNYEPDKEAAFLECKDNTLPLYKNQELRYKTYEGTWKTKSRRQRTKIFDKFCDVVSGLE